MTFSQKLWVSGTLLFMGLFFYLQSDKWRDNRGHETTFHYDVRGYYSYLPAAFIHQDLSFSFPGQHWTSEAPTGQKVAKYTMGMAFLYAPWFSMAHLQTTLSGKEPDPYSPIFDFWVHFGTLVYALIAAFFLIKSLNFFFPSWLSTLTYLLIFFGSNLFYYTLGRGECPHSYLFMLFSIIIWLTLRWHQDSKNRYLFLLAFFCGLSTLVRPSEAIIILFPLLYSINSIKNLKKKAQLIRQKWKPVVLAFLFFLAPLFPQFLYWKIYAGSWLFFSYGSEEGFFFLDPQIWEVLFSYRKGWVLYTPLVALMLTGIFFMKKNTRSTLLPVVLILGVNIYLVSSWWSWWFGGSFGQRALIQHYALLSFPLGALLQSLSRQRWPLLLALPVLCGIIWLNQFQTTQYKHSIIHWDSMTREAYWYCFGKERFTKEQYKKMKEKLDRPDYDAAIKGHRDL